MVALWGLIVCIFSWGILPLHAQDLGPSVNLFKIDAIEIRGQKKVEEEAIREKILAREGSVIDNYLLRSDIERIYKLKFFDTIEAHHEVRDGKNILIYQVVERPIINEIYIEGNSDLDDKELLEQIKSKQYSLLDIDTAKKDVGLLQKFYEDKGFFLAVIDYEVVPLGKENVRLVFHVQEFDKVRVKKVTFLGNKALSDEELKKNMETQEEGFFSFLSSSGSFKEINFQTDIQRLRYYYQTKGHLQVNIGNPEITISEDKRWVFITIQVNEGPKFIVNEINFDGEMLFDEEKLRGEILLKENDLYNEDNLRKDIQKLTEMYQDEGYAFANVLRTLDIVPGENRVNVRFSFEKGKIAYFGKISVKGNSSTRDKVVRRELKIREGMKYSGSLLRESKENVNRLGFFENNSVVFNTVSPKGKDDVLDVEVSVKERQTGQISLGAGYSTATKLFFQSSIKKRNFQGLGQDLTLSFNWSETDQRGQLSFDEPYLFDTKWKAGGDLYTTKIDRSGYEYEKNGAAVRMGYPVFEYTNLFVTYNLEKTRLIESDDPLLDEQKYKDLENGWKSSIETSLSYDRRNNVFEPTGGHYLSGSSEYAGLGGDHKFLKLEASGQYFANPVGDFVFRSRLEASRLIRTTDRDIARTRKFTMGGAKSLRGYGYGEIGPKEIRTSSSDLDGNGSLDDVITVNVGGNFMLLATAEVEHPLVEEAGLKWAVFYDAGNVYDNYIGENGRYSLRSDYGFGFRWFTPIGILRFEFGYPVDPRAGEANSQFHFDIGNSF